MQFCLKSDTEFQNSPNEKEGNLSQPGGKVLRKTMSSGFEIADARRHDGPIMFAKSLTRILLLIFLH